MARAEGLPACVTLMENAGSATVAAPLVAVI